MEPERLKSIKIKFLELTKNHLKNDSCSFGATIEKISKDALQRFK
jgi:hypothetical protein